MDFMSGSCWFLDAPLRRRVQLTDIVELHFTGRQNGEGVRGGKKKHVSQRGDKRYGKVEHRQGWDLQKDAADEPLGSSFAVPSQAKASRGGGWGGDYHYIQH